MYKKYIKLAALFLFVGCGTLKKSIEQTSISKTIDKSAIKKDSANVVERNKEIKDQILTVVPKTDTSDEAFNKRVDEEVDRILSKLNTKKVSGTNSYVSRYDKETRQLIIDFIVAQTESKLTETNISSATSKSIEEKTDAYISKKIKQIPWWIYMLLALWFLPQILEKLSYLINPLSSFLKK